MDNGYDKCKIVSILPTVSCLRKRRDRVFVAMPTGEAHSRDVSKLHLLRRASREKREPIPEGVYGYEDYIINS